MVDVNSFLTLDDLIDGINDEFAGYDPDELAASYVYDAYVTGEHPENEPENADFECHLDVLVENGAVFNYEHARKTAFDIYARRGA